MTRIRENAFIIANEANVFFYPPLTKDKVFLFFCNKNYPLTTYRANIKTLENTNLHQTFEQLLKAHELLVYKICRLYGDTEDDRKDLFQDIVIQLWKAYPNFRAEAKFSTWLYRIGLNVAITQLRKQKNKIYATDIDSLHIAIADDHYSTEMDEQFKEMYAAIEQLNAIEKAIVMLYLEDKSYEEMEEILGISNGNLRVKMNRIKEKLRQITKN
jgi:RNA polymerase sigma-70 factor (ECF subfamily)